MRSVPAWETGVIVVAWDVLIVRLFVPLMRPYSSIKVAFLKLAFL